MSSLYREEIFEHYKNPKNYGALDDADLIVDADNPLCGDSQKWYIKFTASTELQKTPDFAEKAAAGRQNHEEKVIKAIRFTGQGCAISTASASLLSEYLIGRSAREIKYFSEEKMSALLGAKVAPGRIKCLLLPLQALRKVISNL